MAGNVSSCRRHGHQPGAGADRRVRRGPPAADAHRARRAGRASHSPTAHRLVAELVAWGALAKNSSGQYVVGRRLWDIGLLAPVQAGLVETASPFLHDLYAATLATVHLAVRDGTEVLYLDRVRGHASVPVVSTVGSRLPMHATGVGKVLLAHAPADVQAEVLSEPDRITAYTVTQPGTLRRQLSPGRPRRLRDDGRGDEPRRLLGRGADPARAGRRRGSRHRRPVSRRDRPRLVAALQVAAQGIGRHSPGRFH